MLELFDTDCPTETNLDIIAAKQICRERLTPDALEILSYHLAGYDTGEIARELSINQGNVEQVLASSLRKIRT